MEYFSSLVFTLVIFYIFYHVSWEKKKKVNVVYFCKSLGSIMVTDFHFFQEQKLKVEYFYSCL